MAKWKFDYDKAAFDNDKAALYFQIFLPNKPMASALQKSCNNLCETYHYYFRVQAKFRCRNFSPNFSFEWTIPQLTKILISTSLDKIPS